MRLYGLTFIVYSKRFCSFSSVLLVSESAVAINPAGSVMISTPIIKTKNIKIFPPTMVRVTIAHQRL